MMKCNGYSIRQKDKQHTQNPDVINTKWKLSERKINQNDITSKIFID